VELAFVIVLAAIAAAFSLKHRLLRPRDVPLFPPPDRIQSVAERLGLDCTLDGATGVIEGFGIAIHEAQDDRHHLAIDSRGRIPDWIRIVETPVPKKRRASGGFESRDRFFDDRFTVFAPDLGGSALLDGSVRRSLLELGRVDLRSGVLTATITASRVQAVERAFRQLLDAARRLASEVPYAERLLETAMKDQNPFVRLHALEILAEYRPDADETQRGLWAALSDDHVPVALFAAIRLGARTAGDHLKRLARLAASADEERIAAFRELLEHDPPIEVLPLLLEASRSFYGKFAERALAWTIEHGGRDALLVLLNDPGATQAENLIAFLGRAEEVGIDQDMEQAILRILLDTRRRLVDAREHAATVLGKVGTSRSIPALKEIAKGELDAPAHVAKAAREAIARIQARRSAMSGGLSLVDAADGGDLSFSDSGGGALSPAEASADADSSQ
jgi:HEAT repeat protein